MLWVILSLLTALFSSLSDVLGKKTLLRDVNEYIAAFSLRFFSLIVLVPLLFLIKIPSLNQKFWLALLASAILNVIGLILYFKAIKNSDLSLVMPYEKLEFFHLWQN